MLQDLQFAVRALLRSPGFAIIAVVTLALGIGANTAIFSVVDNVVLRPLPYPEADRLQVVSQSREKGRPGNASWLDFLDWRDQGHSFAAMAAWHDTSAAVTGGAHPYRLDGIATTANFFDTVGVPPVLGRGFLPAEDTAGKNNVVVLSWATWQTRYAGDQEILGTTIELDGRPFTIVGVTGEDFRFPLVNSLAFVVPLPHGTMDDSLAKSRGGHYLDVIGRLAPGVAPEPALAEMQTIMDRLGHQYPETDAGRFMTVKSFRDMALGGAGPALFVLLIAVALVLLIACSNVANLLLARGTSRQRELAIRVALGASRGRLVRQMLTESVLLGVLGGGLGILLALWGLDGIRSLIPDELARIHAISIDGRVIAFTSGLAVLTGLVFGLLPALQVSQPNPQDALRAAASQSAGGPGQRMRQILVSAEIALALVLCVGAGLMLRSFQRLGQVDPGFDPSHLVTTHLALDDARFNDDDQVISFYRALLDRLAAIPGAPPAAIGTPLPMGGANTSLTFTVEGRPPPAPGQDQVAAVRAVSPSWFATLGIPLRQGRLFVKTDDDPKAPPVAIVNESFARQVFGDADPLGQHITLGYNGGSLHEVVGVVADVHASGLDTPPGIEIYTPYTQMPWPFFGVVIRSPATAATTAALRDALHAVDKNQALGEVRTMDKLMYNQMASRSLNTLLLGLFALTALTLALIGVYGVMSYAVTQRTKEIGLRMALGARPRDVVRWIVRQALLLAGIGIAVGVAGALALSHWVASLLYGVPPTDPATYVVISALLVTVAGVASYLPARRAARVDPMVALRYD